MSFEKRFDEIIKKSPAQGERGVWERTLIFALALNVVIALLIYFERGSFSLRYLNHSIAWTSTVLIALSFALSGICYFWNFADTKIVYRKSLGVLGFMFGLIHGAYSIYRASGRTDDLIAYFASSERYLPFAFGVVALLIFAIMTAVSNNYMIHELGSKTWRRVLRFGYIAFIFVIVHFSLINWENWVEWWGTGAYFSPPLSVIFLIISLATILLRVLLEFDVRRKKSSAPTPLQTPM